MSKFRDKALHARAVAAAKRKFKVWPSAYASGFVVQTYKRLYKKKHGSLSGAFRGDDLGKWFGEKWVRITSSGSIAGPCADVAARKVSRSVCPAPKPSPYLQQSEKDWWLESVRRTQIQTDVERRL